MFRRLDARILVFRPSPPCEARRVRRVLVSARDRRIDRQGPVDQVCRVGSSGRVALSTLAYTTVTACTGIPLLAVAAATLGLLVALLRERTGSLVPVVTTHLTWSMLMLFFLPSIVG